MKSPHRPALCLQLLAGVSVLGAAILASPQTHAQPHEQSHQQLLADNPFRHLYEWVGSPGTELEFAL